MVSVIEPAISFFVDESGVPDFRQKSARDAPYVICAAAVPITFQQAILAKLPRDRNGVIRKFSDRGLTEAAITEFVSFVCRSPIYVALVLINTAAVESVRIASQATRMSNEGRQRKHQREIRSPSLMYAVLAGDAVINVWGEASKALGTPISYADVILDQAPLSPAHRAEFECELRRLEAKDGPRYRRLEWASEDDEPLLAVPDLLAGVMRRRVAMGDCIVAAEMLLNAKHQIFIQDGRTFHSMPEQASEPAP